MFVVDTNILLYAANASAPEHGSARALLERWRSAGHPWFITWGIVYELLRLLTHPVVLPRPLASAEAWRFLTALRASAGLRFLVETERHAEVLALTLREFPELAGSVLHDVHIAVLMREHGVRRIYTRDTDFHRLPFLDVVDPLRSDWTVAEAVAEYGSPRVRRLRAGGRPAAGPRA